MTKRLPRYKFSIDECDVQDKESLSQFREKLGEWLLLMNDDEHAVVKQIHELLWIFNVFSTIEETRRLEHKAGGNSAALNPVIAEFINDGFVVCVANGIRKLWEKSKDDPNKQIVSLHRVIDDVAKNAHLFTRENYVCHNGLPFDYEAVESTRMRIILNETKTPARTPRVSRTEKQGPLASGMSRLFHKSFDRISIAQQSSEGRSRSEGIDPAVFERLKSHVNMSGIENINLVANKLLFHAGDRRSREAVRSRIDRVDVDEFKQVVKALYEASAFLGSDILMDGHPGGFPTAQYDVFEKLEHLWCTQTNLGSVGAVWQSFASEVSNWDASEKFKVSG